MHILHASLRRFQGCVAYVDLKLTHVAVSIHPYGVKKREPFPVSQVRARLATFVSLLLKCGATKPQIGSPTKRPILKQLWAMLSLDPGISSMLKSEPN